MDALLHWLPPLAVAVAALARLTELKAARRTVPGEVRERSTLRLIMWAGYAVVAAAVLEWILRGRPLHPAAFFAGAALMLGSFTLRRRTIATLDRWWSLHVEIRENHALVTSGPFRWVRHPTYLSVCMEFAAFALLCSAWWTLCAVPFLLAPVLRKRIRIEEEAMMEKFPGYAAYRLTTPALFPYKGRTTP